MGPDYCGPRNQTMSAATTSCVVFSTEYYYKLGFAYPFRLLGRVVQVGYIVIELVYLFCQTNVLEEGCRPILQRGQARIQHGIAQLVRERCRAPQATESYGAGFDSLICRCISRLCPLRHWDMIRKNKVTSKTESKVGLYHCVPKHKHLLHPILRNVFIFWFECRFLFCCRLSWCALRWRADYLPITTPFRARCSDQTLSKPPPPPPNITQLDLILSLRLFFRLDVFIFDFYFSHLTSSPLLFFAPPTSLSSRGSVSGSPGGLLLSILSFS